MDVFLIIVTIILTILLFIVNVYLLAYYSHPDDRSDCFAIICKILVVIGLTLTWA